MTNAVTEFYRYPDGLLELEPQGDYRPIQPDGGMAPLVPGQTADISSTIEHFRRERYNAAPPKGAAAVLASEAARRVYYGIRPALSDAMRQSVQRVFLRNWSQLQFPRWPVDATVEDIMERHLEAALVNGLERIPFIWFWPDGASSAAMMTHDVEAIDGLKLVPALMDVDEEFGIRASYQLVPERRYIVPDNLLESIRSRHCEVNVHGLNHDGNLFRDRKTFLEQCGRINEYVRKFGAEGFRSACMYRNMDWYEDLDVSYDMSVPNVAHLEPQRGGCCTVFPYFVGAILELPLTTIQDYSLFHILSDYSIDLWKTQIGMIMEKHGLISFIVHPDYIFANEALPIYKALLACLSRLHSERNVWLARPGEINQWWRERSAMKLVCDDGMWLIEGRGQERARIAFASVENGGLVYRTGSEREPLTTRELERAANIPAFCGSGSRNLYPGRSATPAR